MSPAPNTSAFARAVLDMAAQVEADEARIRRAILDAATAGDCARVIHITTRWNMLPAAEVLAESALIDAPSPR